MLHFTKISRELLVLLYFRCNTDFCKCNTSLLHAINPLINKHFVVTFSQPLEKTAS